MARRRRTAVVAALILQASPRALAIWKDDMWTFEPLEAPIQKTPSSVSRLTAGRVAQATGVCEAGCAPRVSGLRFSLEPHLQG
jgi:hypothetical protein